MSRPTASAATGLALREPLPWRDLGQVVQTAEETGYDAVVLPESDGREAFSTLAGLATVTTRLRLATGVTTITARDARTTAMAAATVAELSRGRFVLGLGSGRVRELEPTRRYVRAVRAFLGGETVSGSAGTRPRPLELTADVSIWLAALGSGMVRLAGEVADGVLLNWCTPERVALAVKEVAMGAEAAGRDPAQIAIAVYVRACVGEEERVALAALRSVAARYAAMPHYRRQFEAMGLGEEARAAAAAAIAESGGRADSVPEALVRAACVWGRRDPALARLDEYRAAGADVVVVYPVPALEPLSSMMGTVLALAPRPAVES